jgi:hypothetical protein
MRFRVMLPYGYAEFRFRACAITFARINGLRASCVRRIE